MIDELKAVVERLKWSCDLREAQITETALVARTDLLTVIAALDNPITLSGVRELLAKERERCAKVLDEYSPCHCGVDGSPCSGCKAAQHALQTYARIIRKLENQ